MKPRKVLNVALALVLSVLSAFSLCSCEQSRYSRSEIVLGDAIALTVTARGAGAKSAVDEMFALASTVFDEINLSNEDSALSKFNRAAAGESVSISAHTRDILALAESVTAMTAGAFDVTALPLVKLWKLDTEGLNALLPDPLNPQSVLAAGLPSYQEVRQTLELIGMDKIDVESGNNGYLLTKKTDGVQVDLGGIAKGYFTDLCRDIAVRRSLTSCLINLSGNLYLHGGGLQSGEDWTVGILNPRPRLVIDSVFRGHVAAITRAGNCAVVTSGDYERFYFYRYEKEPLIAVTHIVDPRSGLPVGLKYDESTERYYNDQSGVCMAVVSTADAAAADALATAACVLGIDDGTALLSGQGCDGIIFTDPDGGKGRMSIIGDVSLIDGYDEYKSAYLPYGGEQW